MRVRYEPRLNLTDAATTLRLQRARAAPAGASGRLLAPNPVLLGFALLVEARAFTGNLLLDLLGVLELFGGERFIELLLEEDLPLGEFAFIYAIDLGEPGLLLRGQRSGS